MFKFITIPICFFLVIEVGPTNGQMICSQCGQIGQPICTVMSPTPTVCPNGSYYCLNATLESMGLSVKITRSCGATIPSGYSADKCVIANSTLVLASKCACSFNGCNMDPAKANMTLSAFQSLLKNLTFPNITALALAPLDVWRNLSAQMPQVNFSQIMAEFKSLNISSQLQLLTQLTSGNISTTGLLAGLPISQLMNNTGGSLPLMLASMSNVTSGITSMINSFVSKLNVTGTGGSIGPWGSITNMLSGISNVFPSVTSNSIKSNSNTTQKSGGFKSASMWRLEAFVTVLSMVICRYAV